MSNSVKADSLITRPFDRMNAYERLTRRVLAYLKAHEGDVARARSKNELTKMLNEKQKSRSEVPNEKG